MISEELVFLKQKRNLKIQSVETHTEHLASPLTPDNSYTHQLRVIWVRNEKILIEAKL